MDKDSPPTRLTIDDILFVLCRHKWMIVVCFMMGLAGAAAVWKLMGSQYSSEAKLLVRYIVESNAVLPPRSDETVLQLDVRGDSIMRTEKELLWSGDLARNVAEVVGPENIVGEMDEPGSLSAAVRIIQGNLRIRSEANVILLGFSHADKSLCQRVLNAMIDAYLELHTRVHQPGPNNTTLAEEAAEQKLRLQKTESKLLELRAQMGGVSLEDAKSAVAAEIGMLRRAILEREAELASREAVSGAPAVNPGGVEADGNATVSEQEIARVQEAASVSDAMAYSALVGRLGVLRQREQDYLSRFTPENPLVTSAQRQITELEERIQAMVSRFPQLAIDAVTIGASGTSAPAPMMESVPSLKARMKVLKQQLETAREESLHLSELERTFSDIQLSREIQQDNLRHMATTLEQSRYDSALESANRSSIKILQQPSDPVLNKKETKKMAVMVFGGFAGGGLALAFLLELFLDPRVKRSRQLVEKTNLPVYVNIPARSESAQPEAAKVNGGSLLQGSTSPEMVKSPASNGDRSYYEALRDRLIVYFEHVNLRRKPKLVGVSACHSGAGVSTVARGLASTLSETGGGKVLLVDLNRGMNALHTFEEGKPVQALPELLGREPEVQPSSDSGDTLFLASFGASQSGRHPIRSREFDSLIPRLKASDFDFVVFDMPPLTPTSVTFRVAGFLDKMLLVAESERTHMQSMTTAIARLEESNARIALVMNKTRDYLPRWLRPPQ